MNDFLNKSINLIDNIINDTKVQNIDFYKTILKMVSLLFDNKCSLGIFFYENNGCSLKKAIKDGKFVDSYELNESLFSLNNQEKDIFQTTLKNDKLFDKNVVVSKLAIKNSVFGLFILSTSNKLDEKELNAFSAISKVISYKIKDYELNEVFKIQLKAMQDAIVEKENAYDIIKKQHKKLQELDKTKSLFLANISHELRTPLNAIIGFSQALDSKIFGELNEKQSEYIKDIQVSSLHLLGMINEILDISKLEAKAMKFNPTELNANQIIQEVINILEPLYKNKNISIIFDKKIDVTINADYQKFQQILYNLLSNAIKFTNENGKIEIIQEINKNNYILKIKDNGIGIEKKYHNKIFKKFIHIHNINSKSQLSTGLGLTITKELVKLHKGKITVESELNKGTTFIMEFKNLIV